MAHEILQGAFLTRRRLIITAITGVAGFSFAAFCEEHAWAQGQTGDVSDFMKEYADQLKYAKKSVISDYQQSLASNVRGEVTLMNKKMRRNNFTDWDGSNVYREEQTLFYTAGHEDNFNACTAFYDLDQPTTLRTAMEGPTLVGLAIAAQIYRGQKNYSSEATQRLLYPRNVVTASAGTFQKGYFQPDQFKSKDGVVKVDYKNLSYDPSAKTGKGKITVVGIEDHEGDRRVTLNKDLSINYQTV